MTSKSLTMSTGIIATIGILAATGASTIVGIVIKTTMEIVQSFHKRVSKTLPRPVEWTQHDLSRRLLGAFRDNEAATRAVSKAEVKTAGIAKTPSVEPFVNIMELEDLLLPVSVMAARVHPSIIDGDYITYETRKYVVDPDYESLAPNPIDEILEKDIFNENAEI